jgi:hypothetical protein
MYTVLYPWFSFYIPKVLVVVVVPHAMTVCVVLAVVPTLSVIAHSSHHN